MKNLADDLGTIVTQELSKIDGAREEFYRPYSRDAGLSSQTLNSFVGQVARAVRGPGLPWKHEREPKKRRQLRRIAIILYALNIPESHEIVGRLKEEYTSEFFEYPPILNGYRR
jgi:hypothetical protein